MSRKYRDFSYTSSSHTCIISPTMNILHQIGPFLNNWWTYIHTSQQTQVIFQNCTEDFKIGFKTGCSPSRKISKEEARKPADHSLGRHTCWPFLSVRLSGAEFQFSKFLRPSLDLRPKTVMSGTVGKVKGGQQAGCGLRCPPPPRSCATAEKYQVSWLLLPTQQPPFRQHKQNDH